MATLKIAGIRDVEPKLRESIQLPGLASFIRR
jgi:hypothetical protein